MTNNTKHYWMCVIEWDGMQPPKKWYRRLHAFGLVIRGDGDKGLGALQRRAQEGKEGAVVFQEGCILCATEDTARTLALLAQEIAIEFGSIINVAVAQVQMQLQITRTPQDSQILSRIAGTLGKGGRQPNPKNWVVSCQGCGQVTEVYAPYTNMCRNCSGFLIRIREGHALTFRDNGVMPLFDFWLITRFYFRTHWEPADIADYGTVAPVGTVDPRDLRSADCHAVEALRHTCALPFLDSLDRQDALLLLDAMFISRRYRKQSEREERRLRVLQQVIRSSGDASFAQMMMESPTPDLVDAAALPSIGETGAAAYLVAAQGVPA